MRGRVSAAALAVLLAVTPLLADEPAVLEFRAERIEAADWRLDELHASFELSDDGLRGAVRVGRIEVPAAGIELADTAVACGRVLLSRSRIRCRAASLTADFPGIGRQTVAANFDYERDSGGLQFDVTGLAVAGGELRLDGTTAAAGSELRFAGERLEIGGLVDLARTFGVDTGELETSGFADLDGALRAEESGLTRLRLDAKLTDASLSNDAGTLVGAAVGGTVGLTVARSAGAWRFDVEIFADRGEVYIEPVYANLAEHAVRLRLGDVRTEDLVVFDVGDFNLVQDSTVGVSGSASISVPRGDAPATLDSGHFEVVDTAVETVYTSVLQILAAGTMLGDLETAGRVSGSIAVRDSAIDSAQLELTDLILDDRQRRFAVYGLSGTLNWPGAGRDPDDAAPSRLEWAAANLHNIIMQGAGVSLRLGGDDLVLLEPLRIPTMGGALVVNRLVMNDYGTDDASGLLDAELEPIQLGQLTGAFGWPAFSGSLSGRLPLLQYEGNAMTVGGSLTARAFDGDIEVSNLRIAQPFGRVPRLQADVRLRLLDLERLTSTFSFGLIQGRLSGDVTGLRMAGWEAQAMDLHVYTPPDDPSPHRISQRAVENLASVGGGGAAAVLSSGFLQFFEVFAYDRIALRCLLRDGVCAMSGAGPAGRAGGQPAGRGYYIVRGKGLPRIDVVGYRDRVSWEALVRQLVRITRSDARVVK